jgi:hypothetical protein
MRISEFTPVAVEGRDGGVARYRDEFDDAM